MFQNATRAWTNVQRGEVSKARQRDATTSHDGTNDTDDRIIELNAHLSSVSAAGRCRYFTLALRAPSLALVLLRGGENLRPALRIVSNQHDRGLFLAVSLRITQERDAEYVLVDAAALPRTRKSPLIRPRSLTSTTAHGSPDRAPPPPPSPSP